MKYIQLACVLAVASFAFGCSSNAPPADDAPSDPDLTINQLEAAYVNALQQRPYQSARVQNGRRLPSRALIRKRAENLAFRHPDHAPTRVMSGVLAYEFDDSSRATQHLDHALRIDGSNPEAATLRARIALEEGNTSYALRILDEQVRLRPDHAGLREAQASAHFMANDYDNARASLAAAEQLGAPKWRIAYNRGLIDEEAGDPASAAANYQQALALRPGCAPARERLTALERTGGVASMHGDYGHAPVPVPVEGPAVVAPPIAEGEVPSIPSAIDIVGYGNPPK